MIYLHSDLDSCKCTDPGCRVCSSGLFLSTLINHLTKQWVKTVVSVVCHWWPGTTKASSLWGILDTFYSLSVCVCVCTHTCLHTWLYLWNPRPVSGFLLDFSLILFIIKVVLVWMSMSPIASNVWIHGPQLVALFGEVMEVWLCGPGMSREKGFESLKTLCHFQFSCCFVLEVQDVSSQTPCLLLCPHSTIKDSQPSETVSPSKHFHW